MSEYKPNSELKLIGIDLGSTPSKSVSIKVRVKKSRNPKSDKDSVFTYDLETAEVIENE